MSDYLNLLQSPHIGSGAKIFEKNFVCNIGRRLYIIGISEIFPII